MREAMEGAQEYFRTLADLVAASRDETLDDLIAVRGVGNGDR